MTNDETRKNSEFQMPNGPLPPAFLTGLDCRCVEDQPQPAQERGGGRFAHRKAPTEFSSRDHGKAHDASFRIPGKVGYLIFTLARSSLHLGHFIFKASSASTTVLATT